MTHQGLATPSCLQGGGGQGWEIVFLNASLTWKAEMLIIPVIPNAIVKAFWRTSFPLSLSVSSLGKTDPGSATLLLTQHCRWCSYVQTQRSGCCFQWWQLVWIPSALLTGVINVPACLHMERKLTRECFGRALSPGEAIGYASWAWCFHISKTQRAHSLLTACFGVTWKNCKLLQ